MSRGHKANGKKGITFNFQTHVKDSDPIRLPCGKCVGCRLERSRQWAVRCHHESSDYPDNCFLTLTYSDDHLPSDHSLDKDALSSFIKRLRRHVEYRDQKHREKLKDDLKLTQEQLDQIPKHKIKFFGCGEYGQDQELLQQGIEALGRPHYHAIIFNYDFPDKEFFGKSDSGENIYISPTLDKLWGKGHAVIGDVTFESSAYVARYCVKKINGDMAYDHYQKLDEETGEVHLLEPEYMRCSKGIGENFTKKYTNDMAKGYITVNGVKQGLPKYYQKKFEELDPVYFSEYKEQKAEHCIDPYDFHHYDERLPVMEKIKQKKVKTLIRKVN